MKMKKKHLKKEVWLIVAALLVVLAAGSGTGLAWSLWVPVEETKGIDVYAYTQQVKVDYHVHLFPNNLFEEVQMPGRAYLSELTEKIEAEFMYQIEGDGLAHFTGMYSAVALLTITTTGDEKHTVWERVFELLPPQEFCSESNHLIIEETVTIPFAEYRRLVHQVMDQAGSFSAESNLRVEFDLSMEVQSESGTAVESVSPYLLIPLRSSVFAVDGKLTNSSSGSVAQETNTPGVHARRAKTGFAFSTALFAGSLMILFFFTTPVKERNAPGVREASRLLRKYRNQVVRCNNLGVPKALKNAQAVESFSDLLYLGDELGRPILFAQARTANLQEANGPAECPRSGRDNKAGDTNRLPLEALIEMQEKLQAEFYTLGNLITEAGAVLLEQGRIPALTLQDRAKEVEKQCIDLHRSLLEWGCAPCLEENVATLKQLVKVLDCLFKGNAKCRKQLEDFPVPLDQHDSTLFFIFSGDTLFYYRPDGRSERKREKG